ncbi:T9SS type A sorting domain-containing protein [bacterium]|nr:T9SS type A sorting domain-containing protein [bacterium]
MCNPRFRFALAAAMLFISGTVAYAQPATLFDDGSAIPAVKPPNPAARAAYFHDRVANAEGHIPVGARARAWKKAQENLPLFAPGGGSTVMTEMTWTNVGPSNIGGRIITVASNPLNPSTIYIGAAGGGIWRSYDAGLHWQPVSESLPTQAMGALVINPQDTAVIYAGTGEASYAQRTFDGGGMFRSTNGGDSWEEIGVGTLPPYSRASDMVINPMNTDIVYAAIPDGPREAGQIGIYRSTDAGDSWELVLTGRMSDIVINPINPDILYTSSSKVFGSGTADRYGMWKTTDGGDNWFQLDVGIVDSTMGRTSIGICDAQPDVLYIGVSEVTGDDRTHLIGVFKTTDAGAQWTRLDVPFDYMVSQGWYDNIMGVHPTNPDIAYAGGVKIVFTRDGGESWERVKDQGYGGIVHVDQHAIDFNRSDPSIVYLGNDGGFFVGSSDGAAWEKRDRGLSITQFIGGAMHPASNAVLFGGTQDNGTLLSDDAPDFNLVLYGDGGNGAIDPRRPEVMFTTKETLKFYRSEDFGATWTRKQQGLGLDRSLFYIDFAMDPNDPEVLYLGTSRLYKSTNSGESWSLKNSCLIPANGGCYYISAVSVAPYDGNLVFGGGTGGGVSISTNGGEEWNTVADSLLPTGYCSSVRSFSPGNILATYSTYGIDKIWRSTDMGINWSSINGDLPDVPLNDVIELDGKIIVASDVGAFISEDAGQHWQRFGNGMPSVSVQRFVFNERTGILRAITHGRGMYDLQWMVPEAKAPQFVSAPDTAVYENGQLFVYAPVVEGWPLPAMSLQSAPQGVEFDSVLGIVRWIVRDDSTPFVLYAENAEGNQTQQFIVNGLPQSQADWSIVQSQPLSTPVNVMALGGDDALWLGRDSALVTLSPDGGMTWKTVALPGTNAQVIDIHAFDENRAVVGTRSGQILKTTDGGNSWAIQFSHVNARIGNIAFRDEMNGMAVTDDPDRNNLAHVYVTSDGGEHWTETAETIARFPIDNTLTFAGDTRAWFAVSNLSKSPPEEPDILRSSDNGASWRPTGVSAQNVAGISFLDSDRGFCVDDLTGFVRRSINGGVNWRSAFYPMGGERLAAVSAVQGSQVVWIISDDGAWVTPDAGSNWTKTVSIACGPVQDAVFADSATGWIVSKSGIVQKLVANPLLDVSDLPEGIPGDLRITGIFPNPAAASDPRVHVRYATDRSATVTLALYNSAGNRVRQHPARTVHAGIHQAVFNTAGLPSGAYFVSLTSGTAQVTRRMMITQ